MVGLKTREDEGLKKFEKPKNVGRGKGRETFLKFQESVLKSFSRVIW